MTTFGSGLADTMQGWLYPRSQPVDMYSSCSFPSEIVLVVGPFTICTSQPSFYLGSSMLAVGDISYTASPVLREGGEAF